MNNINFCRSIYRAAPHESIPNLGTAPYELLLLLSKERFYSRRQLRNNPLIGDALNSALNALKSERYLFWNIESDGSLIRLHAWHLSDNSKKDSIARAQRRLRLTETALSRAMYSRDKFRKTVKDKLQAKAYFDALYQDIKYTKN